MKYTFIVALFLLTHVLCVAQIDTLKQQQPSPPAADHTAEQT